MNKKNRPKKIKTDSDWVIPSHWKLQAYSQDFFSLTRKDGIKLVTYRTSMMIWGWCISEGAQHFKDWIVAEAAAQYPDPETFLSELDKEYPMSNS